MRFIIICLLIAILVSLGFSLFTLVRDSSQQTRTLKALTWRIGLSILLFVIVLLLPR